VHNNTPTIAVIVAMESERTHLDGLISGWSHRTEGIWPTWYTVHQGHRLIVVECGIGMVSAAAATEHVIATYGPSAVLNFGCTGAHSRELFPGDVVIGTELIHQGRMRFAADGQIIPLDVPFTVPGEVEPRTGLSCDPTLVDMAKRAAREIAPPRWPETLRLASQPAERDPAVITGPIASADIWLQDIARLDAMHQRTGSLCEDMEAAAIAQIATLHGVPFLSIKDISNSEFYVESVFEGSSSALPRAELGKRSAMLLVATVDWMATREP
jgi:adenosylhomocysteine nucleosidase